MSLVGTESLAEHPGTMIHSDITLDEQREMSITSQMVRLCIGMEDPQDLMLNLNQAFDAVGVVKEMELEMT